jgi:hypothetical protein
MVISGTALIESYTIAFTISGKPREWNLTIKAPGHLPTECETEEGSPWALFDEMLVAAYEQCRRIPASARR